MMCVILQQKQPINSTTTHNSATMKFHKPVINFLVRHSGIFGRRALPNGGGVALRQQPHLGEALRTFQGDQSAYNLWSAYRRSRDLPAPIAAGELIDESAYEIIRDLCNFVSTRAIPINFDENLQRPANSDSTRMLKLDTLEKYIGKVIKYFREVYPDHPDWKDLDDNDQKAVPEWWTMLRPKLKRAVERYQTTYEGDGQFGLHEIRPLYSDLGLDDENGKYPLHACDQKHVFVHLIKKASRSNNNLQKVAIINAVAEAIGRGGEAKFQTFRDWLFDYLWNVTNTPWKEKKTIQGYAMPRVADEKWYADWYFIMGMYGMCEKGLYRTPQQKSAGLDQVVFPLLHQMKDERASTMVTETIRSALPAEVMNFFSAKSLRQAGINQAALHPSMTLFYLSAISGHDIDSSTQYYFDPTDVGRGLPTINALHGKVDLKTPVAVPTLEALGAGDLNSALKLMDQVFQCNIPSFDVGGDLYIVKKTFLASLLMHFPDLERDCGRLNRVSQSLFDNATKAGITSSSSPTLPVRQVLEMWSAKIKAQFKKDSELNIMKVLDPPGQQTYATVAAMAEDVNSLTNAVESLTKTVGDLSAKFNEMVDKCVQQEASISVLSAKEFALREEVRHLRVLDVARSQQLMSTPEGGRSNKRSRSGHPSATALFQSDSTDSTDTTTTTVTAAAAAATTTTNATETAAATTAVAASTRVAAVTTSTAAPAAAATAAPAPPPAPARSHTIQYGHTAHQNATGANLSMKDLTLCTALVHLATAGAFRLHSELAKAAIPRNTFSEVSHVKYNLELVDFVARQDDRLRTDIDLLRQAPRDPNPEEETALDDAGGRIEMACRQMLNTLVPSKLLPNQLFLPSPGE